MLAAGAARDRWRIEARASILPLGRRACDGFPGLQGHVAGWKGAMIRNVVALLLALGLSLVMGPGKAIAEDTASPRDWTLESEIQSYLDHLDGIYGVAVLNMRDGRTVAINSSTPFESASLYKLLVAYRVLKEAERGDLSLEDEVTITEEDTAPFQRDDDLGAGDTLTVGDALSAMLTVSSNSAAYALVRISGGWEGMLEASAELGITAATQGEQFMIAPAVYAEYFRKLVSGSMLSRGYGEKLMQLLLDQQVNDRLPALLPPGTTVAHKTGELEDVRNDAGIVLAPNAAYVIVLMANGVSPTDATAAEATISRLVYDRYGAP